MPAAAVAHRALADAEPGDSAAADHAAGRLVGDQAVGQGLLQFSHASVGDFGAKEVKRLHLRQPLQMYQARVADFGVSKVEKFQIGQFLEVLKARSSRSQ